MKAKLSILLAVLIGAALVGCGSSSGSAANASSQNTSTVETSSKAESIADSVKEEPSPETESVEPLDLTGQWIQENADASNYMAATIREDGRIGVFFIMENFDGPQIYWVGTYEAPQDNAEEYSWISENTFGGNALLSSSDETKEFTYQSGKISYPITIQGKKGTVSLIRGDWDVSKIPESAFTSVKASQVDYKDLEVKDSGWCLKNGQWLYYYVVLHNPNEEIAVNLPGFRITARDANGGLLGTTEQYLSVIYPGQDFVFGTQAFEVGSMPENVEFEPLAVEDYNLKNAGGMQEYKPLEVVNANLSSDNILGEINNPNDYDLDQVTLVAICRNAAGELIGVENTYVSDVKANATTPFSGYAYIEGEVASIVCYANQW